MPSNSNTIRKKLQERRWMLLRDKTCERCGFSNPKALRFHHRDPNKKTERVSSMLLWKMETVLAEAAKCDILCANCHAIEHSSPDWNMHS